jgi:hypothetical protein
MKRHTLFIYIAALLTMLGTALPLSAQNKSFTINRNDGASQKYSYSQGDRLVLSREDSQGKKHADFVEQQVYLGNDVHNIPLASIESITFDTQATVDEGKTFTVQESGGKIEYGDISIDFPSGTFNSSTKVTVSEMEKGQMDGENELSKFYKVKLSDGIRKSFKTAIKSGEYANEDVVKMMFVSQGWAPSLNIEGYAKKLGYVAYEEGAYYTEIPAMEYPDNASDAEMFFGLVYHIDDDYSAGTRAYLEDTKQKRPASRVHPDSSREKAKHSSLYSYLEYDMVPTVLDKIKELGFVKSDKSTINYYVESLSDSRAWGCYNKSKLFGLLGHSISLNKTKLYSLGNDKTELLKSVMHETLHYFQEYYGGSYTFYNTATILEEATAVWSERFWGEKLNIEQCRGSVDLFVASLNTDVTDVYDSPGASDNPKWDKIVGKKYQSAGYGAAALIEYLSQKFGDSIVVKLFEKRKSSSDPKNTIAIIEDVVKEVSEDKFDIFTQASYKDFIEKLGCRKLYTGPMTFEHMLRDRVGHGNIGKVSKTITDKKPVNFVNYAFGYGALIEKLTVPNKYCGVSSKGLDKTTATIEQTEEGLKTWVYRGSEMDMTRNFTKFELLGITSKDKPLDISNSFEKKNSNSYDDNVFYLVTIPEKFKTHDEKLSIISAQVEAPELELSRTKYICTSDGFKDELTVKHNQNSIEFKNNAGWIHISSVGGQEDKRLITIDPNPSSIEDREAVVTVCALNKEGEIMIEKDIQVKQHRIVTKIEVEPSKPQEFEAEGGTVTLTVTTNQPQWSVTKKSGNWFNYSTSGNKITVTAFANPTSDPRDGYLEICALNEKNEKVSEPVTIKVKQKGKVVVKLQMSLHIDIALFDGRAEQDISTIVVNLINDENKTEVVVNHNKDDDRYQVMCKGEDGEISFDSDVDIINDLDKLKSGKVQISNLSCMRDGRFSLVASGSSGNSYKEDKNSITYGWDYGSIIYFHDTMTGATLPSPNGMWIVTGGISITRPK